MAAVVRTFVKDFRRFWPLAAAAFVLDGFLGFFPDLGVGNSGPTDRMVITVAAAVRLFVIGFAAVAVVHEDLVDSDRSAWLTRPVAPWQLLGAKLLFLAAALAVPTGVCAIAVSLRYHLGPAEGASVGIKSSLDVLLEAAALACLGSITPSLLAAGVAFGVLTLGFGLAQPYLELAGVSGPAWFVASDGSEVLAMAVIISTLVYQYSRRRLAGAVGVAILSGMIAVAVGRAVSGLTIQPGLTLTEVGLAVEDPNAFVGATLIRPFPMADKVVIGLQVRVSKPVDVHDWVGPAQSTFSAADGAIYSMSGPTGGWIADESADVPGDEASPYTQWRGYPEFARAVGVPLHLLGSTVRNLDVLEMPASDFERLRGLSGTLTTRFKIHREQVSAQGSLPLQVGATSAVPGRLVRVDSVNLNSDSGIQVVIRTIDVVSRLHEYHNRLWALVDDRRNEVSLSGVNFGRSHRSYVLLDLDDEIDFQRRWTRGSAESKSGLDPSWLQDARLVYIDLVYESPGSVDLSAPTFAMPKVGGAQ
jgi:hypothetical protein